MHELPHPAREIGALVGDVAGIRVAPRAAICGCSAPLSGADGRADEMLHLVGLDAMATSGSVLSLGMDRRSLRCRAPRRPARTGSGRPGPGVAAARGRLVHDLARRHAAPAAPYCSRAGTRVRGPYADRVVARTRGGLVSDEPAAHFARTGCARTWRCARRTHSGWPDCLRRRRRGGRRERQPYRVYGTTSAAVGETAYRNGILLHHSPTRPVATTSREDDTARKAPAQSSARA